ncbi:TonB-dependent receptor domain-containing protein [Pedobacter sp. AK013]|uniref:TonB-dependent receptor domain-containing protein n=1 Tax=Pedobacter sp. AK013 TaxID=2723071 RepID=UPI001607715C|nr:TonB-dependent receptor [Pedobacter sp. AK013]
MLFFIAWDLYGMAQGSNRVSGRLRDAKMNEIIPFATVSLSAYGTNALIKIAETDSAGNFNITGIPNGIYWLKAAYIGYKTFIKDSIKVSAESNQINLGELRMNASDQNILKEITVNATKNNEQIGLIKKKFSVEQSLIGKGGTATDLLQNIPTLSIDGSGNLSLRGSSKLNVLIDGKPSLIGGGDIMQILQSIPAASIESIELVTNPSAKYEAQGDTGFINIVLKRNQKLGFNGSVNASAGTRNNYTSGLSLSFENSKVNVYTNYDFQHNNIFSNGHQYLQFLNPTTDVLFSNETFPSATITNAHNIKAGIDYYITPKSLLNFSGGYNVNSNNKNEWLEIKQFSAARSPLQLINNTNTTKGNGRTYNLNLDFVKTFNKPKEELTFSIGYAHGNGNIDQYFFSDIYNLHDQATTYNTSTVHPVNNNRNSYYNVQIDYTLPVGKGSLDAGYRSQWRLDERNQIVYRLDNNALRYSEYYPYRAYFNGHNQIHAFYINYQNQIKDFNYLVGLRTEYANLDGYVNGYNLYSDPLYTPVKVRNLRLYPSVTLTEKIEENSQLQLSYVRRVTRPTPRNYSPIPDISDPVNFDVGNPNILPEDIHAFELSYHKSWSRVNLSSSLYYRKTNDYIAHVESAPVNGVITTTSTNIANAYTGGFEIISRFNVVKSWDFLINANLYNNHTDAAPQFNIAKSSGLSWNANITNNFTVVKNISLQLRGSYQAPFKTAQDRNYGSFALDAGSKINLFHSKVSLSLSGRDILATRKWSFLRDGNGVLLDFERKTIGARGSISFAYNFGKEIFQKKNIEHSAEKQEN